MAGWTNVGGLAQEKVPSTREQMSEAMAWVQKHRQSIPVAVYTVVCLAHAMFLQIADMKQRKTQILLLLRQQMGLAPKSEKGSLPPSRPPASDEERLRRLKDRRKALNAKIRRYEDRLGRAPKKRQKKETSCRPPCQTPGAACADGDMDAVVYEQSQEQIFGGGVACGLSKDQESLKVERSEHFTTPKGLHTSEDERNRYEYGVTTKHITLKVETVTDLKTGKSVTASTDEIGPPNSQATWLAISNTIMMVIGYAVPINRLAKMLEPTCPYFTSSRLCSFLKYAADLFAPIYVHLGEALADADWLLGDDTKARVIEIERQLKDGDTLADPKPDSLIERISQMFGRVFPKKRGSGHKRQLNVSVLIGKTKADDRRSHVFFFRTHLGSLGDLLSKVLEMRDPKRKQITVVSDSSSTNLVSKEISSKFEVIRGGCMAHARRPFFRYKTEDVDLCYWMLSAFLVLGTVEDRIDEAGRTRHNILQFRQKFARKVWNAIMKRCKSVLAGETTYGQRWPKGSKIYEACRYIIDHYEELTRYLEDPRLPHTNNLSERVLRWDKIMQDSSKFRMTEQGRLNVDILRTIVHTCSAAEIDIKDYLFFVFKNRSRIESAPERFTPYAFAQAQDIVTAAAAALQ